MLGYTKKASNSLFFFITVLLAFALAACGRSASPEPKTETAFALDTVVSITYYDARDAAAVQDALALCKSYESTFSRTDPDSELYKLNADGGGALSDDLRSVLETALDICARSGGAFDITMGGVSALYAFSSDAPHAPAPEALAEALCHVGWQGVHLNGSTLTLDDVEAVIDLGAVAKGYIADRMKDALIARGVEHGIINLGGNVLCFGARPDGGDYRIGIQQPEKDSSRIVTSVPLREGSVVTSGVYQRFFEENGTLYHHILSPASGRPVENGLLSVSVVGGESMRCDALSTACFALGLEQGMTLIEETAGYEALFITADNALHPSSGFTQAPGLK